MMKIMIKVALLAMVLCLAGPVFAQSSTQGTVGGTVFDQGRSQERAKQYFGSHRGSEHNSFQGRSGRLAGNAYP